MNVWLAVGLILLATVAGAATWEVVVTQPVRQSSQDGQDNLGLIVNYMQALRLDLEQLAGFPPDNTKPTIIFASDITEDPFYGAMKQIAYLLNADAPENVRNISAQLHGQQ